MRSTLLSRLAWLACGMTATVSAAATDELEEVRITAERREVSLQQAPLTVSALGADALALRGITDSLALNDAVPNLKLGFNGGGSLQVTIRGIGSTNDTEVGNPAVSFNVDGVYMARSRSAMQLFYDLDRVEVLRGPQGTLYGRNATAGSINLISRKPVDRLEGAVGMEFGNYSLLRTSAMLNVPLGAGFAIRGAMQTGQRDGYFRNTRVADPAACTDYADADNFAGRIHLSWQPGDDLSLLLSADTTRLRGAGDVEVPLGDAWRTNPFSFAVASDGRQHTDNNGVTGTLDWRGSVARLTWIGAYREDESHRTTGMPDMPLTSTAPACVAANGVSAGCNVYTFYSHQHSSSHELRLDGSAGRLDWLLGGYSFDEGNRVYLGVFPLGLAFMQPEVREQSEALFGQVTWKFAERLRATAGMRYTHDRKSRVGGTYVFGQQTGETYGCPFGGGLNAPALGPGGIPAYVIDPATAGCLLNPNLADFSWNHSDWKLGAEYDLSAASLLYVNVATGYKAGGYGDGAPPNNNDYGPEDLLAWEIGSKNRLLDDRLQLNVSGFYYDYRDFQVSGIVLVNGQASQSTLNAQRAELYGLEAESVWRVGERGRINLDLNYLHARYREFRLLGDEYHPRDPAGTACALPADVYPWCADYSGQRLARAPRWSGTLGYQHRWPLGQGNLLLYADTHYESAQNLNYHGYPATAQDAFTRSSLSLRYEAPDQRWSVQAWVRNIEGDAVLTSGNPSTRAIDIQGEGKTTGTGSYAPPRIFGLSLAARW